MEQITPETQSCGGIAIVDYEYLNFDIIFECVTEGIQNFDLFLSDLRLKRR